MIAAVERLWGGPQGGRPASSLAVTHVQGAARRRRVRLEQTWAPVPGERAQIFYAERERAAGAGAGEHVLAATNRGIQGVQAVIAACAAHQTELAGEGDQS